MSAITLGQPDDLGFEAVDANASDSINFERGGPGNRTPQMVSR